LIGLALVSTDSTAGLISAASWPFSSAWRCLIVSIQISVQRLHDIGWSGWLWLLNLVPFVGSFFRCLLVMAVPGNETTPTATAHRLRRTVPRSRYCLRCGWSLIALILVGTLAGGLSAIQEEYENAAQSSYDRSSVITDEIDVEVEPVPNSTDDAAEEARPPVDSAKE
jgi:hypothetical protein